MNPARSHSRDFSLGMNTDISERVYGYRPNSALAIAAAVVYGTLASALLFRVVMSRSWWGLCLPIGSFFVSLGFVLRVLSKHSPSSIGIFAIEGLFIICSPAAFLAFNYITYGRLISYIGAEHSIINPGKVAGTFVISDVFTFLLQAGGSGLQTSYKLANTGQKIVLVGLALQAVSYGFFIVLLIKSHISIKSSGSRPMDKSSTLIWVLYFSSAFIFIRCIYRVAEFAQGRGGYLLTHEVLLYLLDVLPLVLAITVYVPFWPARYLGYHRKESLEMNGGLQP
ncbi:RTA1 like protein-domain-containing protein [Thelephora terrestris]|uniref:RTA1 like protein-domain-containing protein n=1 Tax=Thelephora terrestris TaxID=56493 RepID=A0A9P6L3L2_9AGAM|nr:RTA1 like protein-domain-containing protein [Thelephora terrestris]